jgi:DNA-binding response OmpR family regulator
MEKNVILIVDDEPELRELLTRFLNARGYDAVGAADGKEALEHAVLDHPDLILLDVNMPRLDGWKTLTELKRNAVTEAIPVVMLTANSDTEALFKSQALHAVDYFIKPVNISELLEFIRRYLKKRELGEI